MSEMESPDSRRHRGLVLLADAQPGISYTVSGIYERDRRLLEFLEARGIRPAAKLRILERNYDQTLTLSTTSGNVSLGRAAAERVWLAPTDRGQNNCHPERSEGPLQPCASAFRPFRRNQS